MERGEENDVRLLEFEKELSSLINKHSIDNLMATPDYIVAKLLTNLVRGSMLFVHLREAWFGRSASVPEFIRTVAAQHKTTTAQKTTIPRGEMDASPSGTVLGDDQC